MSVDRAERELELAEADLGIMRKRLDEAEMRVTKLRHYIDVAREFERLGDKSPVRRRAGSKAELLVSRCTDLIVERGKNIPTRELVDMLRAEGIVVGGQNPVGNLSGALSRADHLRNDRATGWGLAEWELKQVDQEEDDIESEPVAPKRGPSSSMPAHDDLDDDIPF